MNATKILWGQVLLVSAVVLAFIWGATEWVAWRLAFQLQLGRPWFEFLGCPFYQPPAFFWWWFAYDAYARDIFVEGAYIAASGGIAAVIVAIAMSVWRAREVKRVTTYGSARWAETSEVRSAALLGHDGVLLGQWRGQYLRHDGPEHVLCFAPTRSGKGVGLVVPTLLTWSGSAIVHDIKGENWTLILRPRGFEVQSIFLSLARSARPGGCSGLSGSSGFEGRRVGVAEPGRLRLAFLLRCDARRTDDPGADRLRP